MIGSDKPIVILLDRGTIDGYAYMDDMSWNAMLENLGITK